MHGESGYGLWTLVVLNSAIFIFFAFSFAKPQSRRDWRSLGAFSAFVLALFTEMYGFPLTIYLTSGWLQSRFPDTNLLAHDSGHLWNTLLGWDINPHFDPLHILSNVLIVIGFYMLASAWRVLHTAQQRGELATEGLYARMRHPQYSAFIVIMFGFGWVVYLTIIKRVLTKDMFTSLLTTFGLAIVIQQALNLAFGPEVQAVQSDFHTLSMFDGFVTVANIKFVSFVLCGMLAGAVVMFMKHSRMGQAIRATAQDARAARVMGIDTENVYAFTYSLNAAICGAAGVLISMIWVIQPFYGITHSIRSFVIVTAAGIGNLPGVIMAALGMGVAEQYVGFVMGAEFQQASVVVILLLVLIWRQMQMSKLRQVVQ